MGAELNQLLQLLEERRKKVHEDKKETEKLSKMATVLDALTAWTSVHRVILLARNILYILSSISFTLKYCRLLTGSRRLTTVSRQITLHLPLP